MNRTRTTVGVHDEYKQLLNYITDIRKTEDESATNGRVAEQLILAYAKQLYAGITSATWRSKLLALINQCEAFEANLLDKRKVRYANLEKRAERLKRV